MGQSCYLGKNQRERKRSPSQKVELGKDIDPYKITLEEAFKYLKPKTAKKKK